MDRSLVPTTMIALALAVSACGEDEQPEGEWDTRGRLCEREARADPWEPPIDKAGDGGLCAVRLLSSDPEPPADTDNRWVVQVLDPAGSPIDEARITRVEPRMPDHGHGSAVPTVVTPIGEAGRHDLNPVNLGMAGYWTIDVDVALPGDTTDHVQFRFCVEG